MRVDPAIAAMRGDRTPQRRAQAAMAAVCDSWRAEAGVAPVLAALERYGRGTPLVDCPELARLFAPGDAARRFSARFSGVFAVALSGEPLGQLPFRHSFDGALATLLLARAGTAQLTLSAQEPGEHETASVVFSDAVRHDAVVAGAAQARATRRMADGSLAHREMGLVEGCRIALHLAGE